MQVSFSNDISHLFLARDLQCMSRQFVYLDDYNFMSDPSGDKNFADHSNARTVQAYLLGTMTPRMPLGGPYWPQEHLDLYQSWITNGFQP
jgi:hypothetical protein